MTIFVLIPVFACQPGSLFLVIAVVFFIVTKYWGQDFCYACFYCSLLLLFLNKTDNFF